MSVTSWPCWNSRPPMTPPIATRAVHDESHGAVAYGRGMRITSNVMSVSWIPSEAIRGATRLPFDLGITHYDDPPPDHIDDIDALHRAGAFRFANVLRAWVDVEG